MLTDPRPVVRTLNGSPYKVLDEFFIQHGKKPQLFRINPLRRTTIVGEQGLRLTFFPFSFCDLFGQPIEEEVTLQLVETGTRREMIFANKYTFSEDRLLEAGGMFYLQAYSQRGPLELCQPIAVELPVRERLRNPLAMRLFAGSTSSTRPYSADRSFDWKLVSDKVIKVKKQGGRKFFSFELASFNWYTCAHRFARRSRQSMFSIKTVFPVREMEDQVALLIFRHVNAVVRLYPGQHTFTVFNVPDRMQARALTIGLYQGQMFVGVEEIEHTSGRLIHVSMTPVSEAELLRAIDQTCEF